MQNAHRWKQSERPKDVKQIATLTLSIIDGKLTESGQGCAISMRSSIVLNPRNSSNVLPIVSLFCPVMDRSRIPIMEESVMIVRFRDVILLGRLLSISR